MEPHLTTTGWHLHMGSHSISSHPTQVNTPCLNPSKRSVLDVPSNKQIKLNEFMDMHNPKWGCTGYHFSKSDRSRIWPDLWTQIRLETEPEPDLRHKTTSELEWVK